MGTSYNPKIITNSLALNIDPANIKSYPAGQDSSVNSITLLLDGESLVDKSVNTRTFTAAGSAAVSTANKKFGNSSIYCTGSGGSRIYNSSFNSSFSGDFTIEFWAYHNSFSTANNLILIGNESSGRHALYITSAGKVNIDLYATGSAASFNTTISTGVWTHYALVRSGTTVRLFVNGVVDSATGTISGTFGNSGGVYIGADSGGANSSNAYFDDIRITAGVARYSSNFTVPQSALPLPGAMNDVTRNAAIGTLSNTTFNSANQGSIVFNGTNGLMYYPSNTKYSFGTGDFTIEAYCQVNLLTNSRPIVQNDAVGSSSNDKWWLAYDATAAGLRFGRHFTPTYASCAWNPTSGQWYHVAAVRSSNLMYFYINGLSQSVTNQSSMSGISFGQNGLSIGGMSTPYYLNGNIAAFRMYNRGLNSTEVYNNYVSDRGRFGV